MTFEVIRDALKTTLTASASGRFNVDTFQRQSHAADELVGSNRHVSVFYRSGSFDKGRSAWLQGPFRHGMTFAVDLLLAAPAKMDLTVLKDPNATPQELMSALAALQEAGDVANLSWDELADIVWNILMDPRNSDLGLPAGTISDRWIANVQKESPAPMGEYVLLSGTMDFTCNAVETPAGEVGVAAAGGVDISLTETADITGAGLDSAKQGVSSISVPAPSTIISTAGLEAYWSFDNESSRDFSGHGRDLSNLVNMGWAQGVAGGAALSFPDRSVIRAAYGGLIDFSAMTAFSISWWRSKTGVAANYDQSWSFGVENADGFQGYINPATSNAFFSFSRAGAIEYTGMQVNAYDATVRHYVLTFDLPSKTWIFYKDGIAFPGGTGVLTNVPVMPNRKFVIGNAPTPTVNQTSIGLHDEFRLYSRVLTLAEVANLAQNPAQKAA
jgi:hypothetical protein